MKYSIIIVAAGMGTRMNLGYNKAYYRFKNNKTVLETTMNIFLNDDRCTQVIVVSGVQDYRDNIKDDINGKIVIVSGGDSRQESVFNGLKAVNEEVVLIHDGARPFVSKNIINNVIKAMETNDACCVMIPLKDTIKKVIDNNIIETIPRDTLRAAQTPQAFKFNLLWCCMKQAFKDNYLGTDDSSIVEKYSDVKVKEVIGEEENYKITTPNDIIGL